MNLDYFFIEALVAQLDTVLKGTLVKKIHQPRPGLILIVFWNGHRERRLQLSIEAGQVFLGLTELKFRNPMHPPRFCQLLRAHLHRLEQIRMLSYDRRVGLFFVSADGRKLCLIFDMFGRSANMLLYSANQGMLDCMRRNLGTKTVKQSDVFAIEETIEIPAGWVFLEDMLSVDVTPEQMGGSPATWLQEHIMPMSRSVARRIGAEILQRHTLEILHTFASAWKYGELIPEKQDKVLTMWLGKHAESSADTTLPLGLDTNASVDINGFLNQHLQELNDKVQVFAGNPELLTLADRALKKLRKRRRNIEHELGVCARHEEYQLSAELLDAHRYLLQRGMDEVEVQDYYRDPPESVSIRLDPARTVQENINAAYNRARKARRGMEHCHRRMQETERELSWLEEIRQQLSSVESAGDEELLRAELQEHGYLRSGGKARGQHRRINPADLVRTATSPRGFQLMWGRNSKTNAYISRHVLRQDDLWFHAHNTPGCHLVLKTDGREPDIEDIRIAAAIAAYYSVQKQEHNAEVMWTKGKHVKQIKGGRPGMVTVATFSTLKVTPKHEQPM